MTKLIDTHVHLQDKQYRHDLKMVLERAAENGVISVIIPGTNIQDSMLAVELAERFTQSSFQVFAAVGVHPTEANELTTSSIKDLRALAAHECVVAVGEIGLDYYWPNNKNRTWQCAEPSDQLQVFALQLDLAAELSLPVIIHNRDADNDVLEMLEKWRKADSSNQGVLHSYSCGVDNLRRVIELGFYISIAGSITYKNARILREVARQVPAESLLIETDGPYLAPEPHRGKRNEPHFIKLIAERIGEERSSSLSQISELTTQNAISLFRLN